MRWPPADADRDDRAEQIPPSCVPMPLLLMMHPSRSDACGRYRVDFERGDEIVCRLEKFQRAGMIRHAELLIAEAGENSANAGATATMSSLFFSIASISL